MEGLVLGQDIRERIVNILTEVGATEQFSQFFADVTQCEYDIHTTLHRLHQFLSSNKPDHKQPELLLQNLQELTKSFNMWKGNIDSLYQRGKDIPPLKLDQNKINQSKVLRALCSVETNHINMKEGEEITIVDSSHPNRLRVRNTFGQEDFVPALCCILPAPDKNARTATERLRVQLVTSWVESVKKSRLMLMESLLMASRALNNDWKTRPKENSVHRERIARRFRRLYDTVTRTAPHFDLTKLHNALFSLEKELLSWNMNRSMDVGPMIEVVASLDKSVLCYQMFTKQLYLYRRVLERSPRPIAVLDNIEKLRPARRGRQLKYMEVRMTVEHTETVEEIIEMPKAGGSSQYGEGSESQTVQSEQLTSASSEERKRFVIRCVVDPRNNQEISIAQAIEWGIVNQAQGTYVNPLTGTSMPIPEAMNTGYIKVEQATTTKTREETKAIGLITIKTQIDDRQFTIKEVTDPASGQRLTPDEARSKGIINEELGQYVKSDKETISLDEAIHKGLLVVEYDRVLDNPEYKTVTYAVNAVVDQKRKKKVPFQDAVKLGLIDRETGSYINNLTGERVFVTDAIKKGFLKAKEIEDASGMDIDAENRVVIERMERIRKNMLKSVGVIHAFRQAAGLGQKSSSES